MRPLLVAAACVALAAGGCGLGPGPERPGGVELRVTRDFGQASLHRGAVDRIREGQTVMDLLQRERRVDTTYGGAFVQAIDGIAGEGAEGRRDWFYFVNGIEAEVGAAERRLRPGDVVHWDYRRWDTAMSVPAIVGAYPTPLVGAGPRTRLECASAGAFACSEARRRLAGAGVALDEAPLGAGGGEGRPRVVVAEWPQARRVGVAQRLGAGPAESGVFARFAASGRRLELLDAGGHTVRAAPPGTGLVAALGTRGGAPTWVLTGVDARGVDAAARALDARALRDRYAVAAEPGGPLPLPLGARTVTTG